VERIERNLYLHENGYYYAILQSRPQSLGTKKVSEARRLLSGLRAQVLAAKAVASEAPPAGNGAPAIAGTVAIATASPAANGCSFESAVPVVRENDANMAALAAMVTSLSAQITAQSAIISQLQQQQTQQAAKPSDPLPPIPYEDFHGQNRDTLCSTGKKDTKRMYKDMAKRTMYALRVHQRWERMKAARGGLKEEPELWGVLRKLGPGGIWGFWRDRKKMGASGLNQLRCYLRGMTEEACDKHCLDGWYQKLVEKVPLLPVDPALPMIPETDSMAALYRAVRSVDEAAADLVEWTACTGQRPCNTRDIWWEHIDLPNRIMRVAQDKRRPPVDLSNEAVELLHTLKGDEANPTGPVIRLTDRLQKKALSVLKQCVSGLKEEHPDPAT